MAKKKKSTKRKAKRPNSSKAKKAKITKPAKSANKGPIVHIRTFAQFKQKILHAEKPAIVDFWAPWCVPCQAMAPIFDAAAQEHHEDVTFAKVNTEEAPKLSEIMGIRSIPTLLAFYGGEVADIRIGVTSKRDLDKIVAKLKKQYQKDHAPEVNETEEKAGEENQPSAPEGEKSSFFKKLFKWA